MPAKKSTIIKVHLDEVDVGLSAILIDVLQKERGIKLKDHESLFLYLLRIEYLFRTKLNS